jgi:putative ABC transport system permease protein
VNKPSDISPPKWPLKLLHFFIKKEYREEIEGDMAEVFYDNVDRMSLVDAKRQYTKDMFRLLRPILMQNLEGVHKLNQYGMFKNYFKVSVRGLMKTPVNSFINIFGLALAIGVTVFAYAFGRWIFATDQFHAHKHEVHLVTFMANRDGAVQQFGFTPRPLGEMMRADFANIEKVCRIEDRSVVVKYQDNVFHEKVRYVDPEFLEMFTFPLKWGIPGSLRDINSIILSEEMSTKYFGDENPLGREINVKFSESQSKEFKVTGVAQHFRDARSFDFDFLINFENYRTAEPDYDFHDWRSIVQATFIQVKDPADLQAIEQGMGKYKELQNKAVEEDWKLSSFKFEPLATLHKQTGHIRSDISVSSDGKYDSIVFVGILCAFMLALACFNYINIAIVTAAKRLKEIGVRKTIGASRGIVITQFLTENIVVTFFAMIMGVIVGKLVFVPFVENLNHFDMEFTLFDVNLWIYLPIVLLVTALASGTYPSIYISQFQVAGIMKGNVQFGRKNPVTKIFLGLQLVLACVIISSGVLFSLNTTYMAERSWGYNQHGALYVVVSDAVAFDKMNAVMARNPNVEAISGAQHHLGKSNTSAVAHRLGRQYEVDELSVDAHYFETLGLELASGRVFRENYESDKKTAVVNQALVDTWGLKNPIGELFKIDSIQYEIIGVVKDFHSYSFFRIVKPTIFVVADKSKFRYLALRVTPGAEYETSKTMQAGWSELYPEIPFEGGFQEDVWGTYFEQINIHARVWRGFALLAILLAGLGLYGLISLNVEGRAKEFSIRKILGAGLKNIASNITSQYLVLYVVALSIAAPVSYFLNKVLFDFIYYYHMPITYSGVAAAASILVLALLVTASTQINKVLKTNPVNGLKVE